MQKLISSFGSVTSLRCGPEQVTVGFSLCNKNNMFYGRRFLTAFVKCFEDGKCYSSAQKLCCIHCKMIRCMIQIWSGLFKFKDPLKSNAITAFH